MIEIDIKKKVNNKQANTSNNNRTKIRFNNKMDTLNYKLE